MGDTLAQIATACARYGFGGTDDITRLKAFINETYRDLFYRQKWTWAENLTTITLNAGASSATVPSGSYQYGEIRKVTSPSTYPYEPPKFTEYADDSHGAFNRFAVTVVGAPEFYTIFAGTIYFDRIADTQYQYEFFSLERADAPHRQRRAGDPAVRPRGAPVGRLDAAGAARPRRERVRTVRRAVRGEGAAAQGGRHPGQAEEPLQDARRVREGI